MADEQALLAAIDAAEENSYGADNDGELAGERAAAIDYYLGRNVDPAPDGRSQVVDRSVYETIQWIKPSLARIFASGDDVVEIPPVGPEDEAVAKQESQYLNYVVLQRNNWFETFNTAASDALLTKAAYLMPYKEKRRQVEIERYERQTAEGLSMLQQDGAEFIESKSYPDPDAVPQQIPDPMTGQLIDLPPPMLYDVTLRRSKEEVRFCILPLPPERCKVAKSTTTVQLRDCAYFEYWDFPTLSELRAEGYDIDDDVAGDPGSQPEEDVARNKYSEEFDNDERTDPAMKRVRCRWIWIRHDTDGDGIAELQHVVRIGQTILHREEVNRIPIAVLCPDPLPHRHVGLSVADTVIDIQRIKTVILRQGLDNLYLANNARTYVNPALVNLDDLVVSRPGGVVRGKGIFGQDIAPLPTPFVFPQAMEGLEYMDQIRENRTGTNRYFTGIDQNALNKTATGIQQLSSMAAQRVEQIARNFANGIEELFSILHELILKSGHKAETIKLRGQWVQVNPAEWRRRTDFKISVGYAAGNKDAAMQRLLLLASKQGEAMAGGVPIVNPRNLYETAIELTKAADFATPERFWTDPSTVPPPPPPQPDPTVMAAEQLKSQTTLQVKDAELRTERETTVADLQTKKEIAELQAQTQLTIEQMQREHEAALEVHRTRAQVGMKQMDGEQAATLEQRKVEAKNKPAIDMAGQAQQMASQLQEAVESMRDALSIILTAKRQIRRGKDGKAEGVDTITQDGTVLASQKVERGPDGRIVGAA